MRRRRAIYGISRVDHANSGTYGWIVTIQRRGVMHRKHFADRLHGGKTASLVKAKRYRDEIIARYPPLLKREHAEILKPNNRSGVTGVCRCCASETLSKAPPEQRWYWVASWTLPDGRRRHRKFSIRKYGQEESFRLASSARRALLDSMPGDLGPGATQARQRRRQMR